MISANACLIVAQRSGQLAGYALLLFHRGASLARLYSIAVAPAWRGHGLGQRLLDEVQARALERHCAWVRLEVRADNPAAVSLYEANGYQRFAVVEDYYEDHAQALRYEKRVLSEAPPPARQVPYYADHRVHLWRRLPDDGHGRDCTRVPDRDEEIQLWREATTVFMTAGHGGCSPQGGAGGLEARLRGAWCSAGGLAVS
jgi:GNAT superfamily N-acetyltransferase